MDEVILHLHFSETLSTLDQLVESVVGTDFQKDVHVFVVFENVFELDDVVVVEGFVDLDFGDELRYKLEGTFCLALDLFNVLLGMILAASTFLV